jgi:hypothetical protein
MYFTLVPRRSAETLKANAASLLGRNSFILLAMAGFHSLGPEERTDWWAH